MKPKGAKEALEYARRLKTLGYIPKVGVFHSCLTSGLRSYTVAVVVVLRGRRNRTVPFPKLCFLRRA